MECVWNAVAAQRKGCGPGSCAMPAAGVVGVLLEKGWEPASLAFFDGMPKREIKDSYQDWRIGALQGGKAPAKAPGLGG